MNELDLMAWNLYVWRDVLCDYSCGMAFAVAPNLETAIQAAAGDDLWIGLGIDGLTVTPLSALTGPIGAYVYGGG